MITNATLLIIFAKTPVPGKVKTRLIPVAGEEGALALYRAFLADVAETVKNAADEVRLMATPSLDDEQFEFIIDSYGYKGSLQQGADLGERMFNAFEQACNDGFEKIVMIGADSPTLSSQIVQAAFDQLGRSPLVFGPAADGGYYLIGMHRDAGPCRFLFDGMPFSTPEVLELSRARAAEHGIEPALLPTLLDIDTPEALFRLHRVLHKLAMIDQFPAPTTWKLLEAMPPPDEEI